MSGLASKLPSSPAAPVLSTSSDVGSQPKTGMNSMTRMSSLDISSITKKMGAGLNTLTGVDHERKAKLDAEERKNQMASALLVLESVKLQCPQTHTGLVLAFTDSTLSPIINPGVKFTWFRMSGGDQIDQVEESMKAWYPPTVDDIGSIICAQCEDNYDQGCSKYVEV